MGRLKLQPKRMDWSDTTQSVFFFNPRDPSASRLKDWAKKLPFFKAHIYLLSSSGEKVCILPKSGFLQAAKALNSHLKTQPKDRWLSVLPSFHVSGLAPLARSFEGGFSCLKSRLKSWSAKAFHQELKESEASLSSLVPAQVYDLIQLRLKSPKSLRAVMVGGGALSPLLYKKARELSWPILPSYGLTETGGAIACAGLKSMKLKSLAKVQLLKHIQIKALRDKTFKIKSPGLITACFDLQTKKLFDPKDSSGWLVLPDQITLKGRSISVLGRWDERVKILGELVSLQKLSFRLEELRQKFCGEYHLVLLPDSRKGFNLTLISSNMDFTQALFLAQAFNQKSMPFERIQALYFLPEIKKSALFKLRPKQLKELLKIPHPTRL